MWSFICLHSLFCPVCWVHKFLCGSSFWKILRLSCNFFIRLQLLQVYSKIWFIKALSILTFNFVQICLFPWILLYILEASIASPILPFMPFSVSIILPRCFMVIHSSLHLYPHKLFFFSVLILRFFNLAFKGSSFFKVSLCCLSVAAFSILSAYKKVMLK